MSQATGGRRRWRRPLAHSGAGQAPGFRAHPLALLVMTVPGLTLFGLFVLVPVVLLLQYSTTDWDGFSPSAVGIGLDNYARAFRDPTVLRALWVTLAIALGSTAIVTVIGIALAVLLNREGRAARFFQAAFFLPIVLSAVVVGFVWQALLAYEGVVNSVLRLVGLDPVDFLGNPRNALLSIVAVCIWQVSGFTMILYLAALKTIPRDVFEASQLDGAGPVKTFRFVTLPLLTPALTANTVILMIFFLRIYEYVAVLTGGGPAGSTETLAFRIVREGTRNLNFGYASSIAVLLLLLTLVVGGSLYWVLRKAERV